MGFRNIRISDVSGVVLDDDQVVNVHVKSHPDCDPCQFDCSIEELKALKVLNNLVVLELHYSNGETKEVACTGVEFAKVVPQATLDNADGLRGRRRGYKPNVKKRPGN